MPAVPRIMDPMFGARCLACCGLATVGCLAAPPDAPPQDEIACRPIARGDFDDGSVWGAYAEPGAAVSRSPADVRIRSTPSEGQGSAYGDLHSLAMIQVSGTALTATLGVLGGDGAVVGISWTSYGEEGTYDDDYYDLVVDDGRVAPAYKSVGGERVVLCGPGCPRYDPSVHARLRIRAAEGDVVYQAAPL